MGVFKMIKDAIFPDHETYLKRQKERTERRKADFEYWKVNAKIKEVKSSGKKGGTGSGFLDSLDSIGQWAANTNAADPNWRPDADSGKKR